MITALDSSVILDVLLADAQHVQRSIEALRRARSEGQLVVCDVVLAEISPVVGAGAGYDLAGAEKAMAALIEDWSLVYVPASEDTALLAGRMFGRYLQRGGKRGRVVADFIIGAHATLHADRLLSRDDGFQRDYFGELEIWYP